MRKLMWFAVGFTAACALGIYLVGDVKWLPMLAGICALIAPGLYFLKAGWAKFVRIVLLGCALSFLWLFAYDMLYIHHARQLDGQKVNMTITVTDYSYETNYGVAADGKGELADRKYKVRLYYADETPLSPGDQLSGEFYLRFTGRGGAKETTYHAGKGIFLLAYAQNDVKLAAAQEVPMQYFAAVMRQRICTLLESTFPQDTQGFARALLLGDSSMLSYETDSTLKVSGIRHVIAVSGLHVSILFSLVYFAVGKRRVLTAVIGLPVLLLFAAVAGFSPSIIRACIMQGLMILALLLNQEYDPPTALATAVLTMLVCNPITVTDVSFQLSAGCMTGIFLFSQKIYDTILNEQRAARAKGNGIRARLYRWFAGSVSVSLGAMSLTTPLCAVYFGSVSLVGILTNLLVLWVVSFIFYGIISVCVLTLVWQSAAKLLAWAVSWLIRFIIGIAQLLSRIPFAAVYTCSVYLVIWLICVYILVAVFLLVKKKKPAVLVSCIAGLYCVCLLLSLVEPKLDAYRVSVLDVGQGQCILLQTDGKTYMVDCGGDNDKAAADAAAQQLLSQGISRLDGVILTHYDLDHVGGAELLLTRISADKLYLPDVADDSGIKERFAQRYSENICWLEEGKTTVVEDAPITLFSAQIGQTGNESSICVLFQPENCDILIVGDRDQSGELALLEQTDLPELELLVVGHHGAQDATGLALLRATKPKTAVISVGINNMHGHPSQKVLDRLALFDCIVWRTDLDGTIIFRG